MKHTWIVPMFGWTLIIAGLLLFFGPDLNAIDFEWRSARQIRDWEKEIDGRKEAVTDTETNPQTGIGSETGADQQASEESDTEHHKVTSIGDVLEEIAGDHSEEAIAGDMLGYLYIPAMKQNLPIYWGATPENLSKGVGVLENSSLPQGGIGTNCVLAGHRGYRGIPFFQYIELLQEGDPVYIRNEKETLSYRVESIRIIDPSDIQAVEAQEGKDMITLLTCHPYMSHGRQRYLVYCVREGTQVQKAGGTANGDTVNEDTINEDTANDDTANDDIANKDSGDMEPAGADEASLLQDGLSSSRTIILGERWLRNAGLCIIGILFGTLFVIFSRRKQDEERMESGKIE